MAVLKGVSHQSISPCVVFVLTLVTLQFLERDTSKRLGCKPNGEGFQELRRLAWFKPIDWDTLDSKEQIPPFVPDGKKANFDASHELEELLLEDNPLKAKARKANQENFSPEMKQMEEQCVFSIQYHSTY
jgi:serine/threonine kinase 32